MNQQSLLCFSVQQPGAGISVARVVCLLMGLSLGQRLRLQWPPCPTCPFSLTPGQWVFSFLMKGSSVLGKDILENINRAGGSEDRHRSPAIPVHRSSARDLPLPVTSRFPRPPLPNYPLGRLELPKMPRDGLTSSQLCELRSLPKMLCLRLHIPARGPATPPQP